MTIQFDAFENHNLNYRSGMLQSWNQMCFKGGYMEASISLPGAGDTIGFWPGFWSSAYAFSVVRDRVLMTF